MAFGELVLSSNGRDLTWPHIEAQAIFNRGCVYLLMAFTILHEPET